LTRDDLLSANKDLISEAGKVLKNAPVRLLTVSTSQAGSTLTIQVTTVGILRLDTYIDGRPLESLDINDGIRSFNVDLPAGANLLELAGYKDDEYVAARKVHL
jgi:hypothetical protein